MGGVTEVTVDVDASPDQIYALVSDLPNMGRWSPECHRCEWVGEATAAAPGARFVGYNRHGIWRWRTKGRVVVADPGRELSFDVHTVLGLPVSRWSYRMAPREGGGARLTESTTDRRGFLVRTAGMAVTGVRDRASRNRQTMRLTLRRLKAAAEAAQGSERPGPTV